MNRSVVAIVICGIVLLVTGIVLLTNGSVERSNPTYSGKEVFCSQEEYVEFRERLGKEDIVIVDIKVLSSEVPIIVDFEVRTKSPFSYGSEETWHWKILLLFGGINLAMGGVLVVAGLKEGSKVE